MISTKQYIELRNNDPENPEIIEYNKALLERYPFMEPRNVWTGESIEDYTYSWTLADDIPDGWRVAFGDQMLEELREELIKFNYLNDYRPLQIKEKYGTLRWYDSGIPAGELSEDYKEATLPLNEPITVRHREEVAIEIGRDNYTPFDPKTGWEEYERLNKDCKVHYRIYRIVDRCKVHDIIGKYEDLSIITCIDCGAQTKPLYAQKGWINYVCEDCAKKRFKRMIEVCRDHSLKFAEMFEPVKLVKLTE